MAVPIELAKSDRCRSGGSSETTRQKKGVCFIPLTVESFLWQQTCSFMRARLSKVCDAACASLERILVQGILDGLTPPLAQAINSTPRWYLIRGAFPHILHSCASLLRHRASFGISGERLSPSESKMMYILHWILLDALSECVDSAEFQNESLHISTYLLSLDDIRLLVYAIVPLLHTLRESNFNAPRLEAGLKIWQALWRFRQPDVVFLSMPVRVRPHDARLMLQTKPAQVATADVYVGDSLNIPTSSNLLSKSRDRAHSSLSRGPSALLSNDPPSAAQRNNLIEEIASDLAAANSPAVITSPYLTVGSISARPSINAKGAESSSYITGGDIYSPRSLQQLSNNSRPEPVVDDLTKATFFDVAVLQCLLGTEPWCEEGAHWSVKYLHLRVLDIQAEVQRAKALADAAWRLSRSYSFGWRRRPNCNVVHRPTSMTRKDSFEKLRLMFASSSPIRSPHPFRRLADIQLLTYAKSPLQGSRKQPAVEVGHQNAIELLSGVASPDLSLMNRSVAMSDSTGRPTGLLKSYTDSALRTGYGSEHLEADGCQHYILPDGSVDLEVVLLATALACRRHASLRVCQSAIQVIHSLVLLEIFGSPSNSYAQRNRTPLQQFSPVVAAAIAGDEHRRFLAAGQTALANSSSKGNQSNTSNSNKQISSSLNNRASDFCDRDPPVVTNHNIAVGTLLKIYEILGAPSSSNMSNASRASYSVNKIAGDTQTIDYREQLMAYAAETARELHRVDRHQFHSYVNEYVSHAPLSRLIRLYIGALGGRGVAQTNNNNNSSNSQPQPLMNVASPNLRAKDSTPVVRHSLRQWLTSVGKHIETLDVSQSGSILRDVSYILNNLAVLHPRLLRRVSVSCILDVVPSGFGERIVKAKQTAAGAANSSSSAAAEKDEKMTTSDSNNSNVNSSTANKQKEQQDTASTFEKFEKILEKFRLKDAAAASLAQSSGDNSIAATTQQSPSLQNASFSTLPTTPKVVEPPVITLETTSEASKALTLKNEAGERLSSFGSSSSIATAKPAQTSDNNSDQPATTSTTQTVTPNKRKIHFKQPPRTEPPEEGTEVVGDTSSTSSMMRLKVPPASTPSSTPSSPVASPVSKTFGMATLLVQKFRASTHPHSANSSGGGSSTVELGHHTASSSDLASGSGGGDKASANKQLHLAKESEADGHDSGLHDKSSQSETGEEQRLPKVEPPIDANALFLGIRRLNLLIELGIPSALPDAGLVASMLDLRAPVLPRACFLLECAAAINAINRQPSRLVAHLPTTSSAADTNKHHLNTFRQMAKICHSWAEAIGARLAKVMAKELAAGVSFSPTHTGTASREETENYFIDSTVNNEEGDGCPHALKRLACMVLLEVTVFLRETFRSYTRELLNKKHLQTHAATPLAPVPSGQGDGGKNLPSASPSIGSRQQAGNLPGQHQADHASDSLYGSTSSLDQAHKEPERSDTGASSKTRGRSGSTARRSSVQKGHHEPSLNKRFSIQHQQSEGHSSSPRHSPRQLSDAALESPSQHSAEFPINEHASAGQPSGGAGQTSTPSHHHPSSSHQQEPVKASASVCPQEVDDQQLMKNFPWLRSVTHLAGYFSFVCAHPTAKSAQCAVLCVERQRRDCLRLINALHLVYKPSRLPSQLNTATRHSSAVHNYIDTRCRGLLHVPFSTLLKAACVIDEETWQDAMGPAWELITDSDLEHSAAAACLFLLTTLKLHESAYDLIQRQLEHAEPVERISAIYRFQLIWQSRFQVWSRMETGAQTRFKVPPPNIDFVLPSPMVGLAVSPVVDAPWLPKTSSQLSDVTTLHGHESVKSLVTATTTHHRQQIETINKALMAEEKRMRSARDNYPLSAMCLTVLTAAQEPALAKASAQHGQQEKEKQPGNNPDDLPEVPSESTTLLPSHHPPKYQTKTQQQQQVGKYFDDQQIRRPSAATGGGHRSSQGESLRSSIHRPSRIVATSVVMNAARRFSMIIGVIPALHNPADHSGPTPTSSSNLLSIPSMISVNCSSTSSHQVSQSLSRMREAGDPQGASAGAVPTVQLGGTSIGAVDANWSDQLNRISAEIGATTSVSMVPQQVTVTPHSFYTPAACATIAKLFEMLLDYDVGFPAQSHHQISPSSTSSTLQGMVASSHHFGNSACSGGFGLTPGQAAADVIWHSLCDDPTLTLRFFFERLTHTDKLDKLLLYLRHLITHYGGLLPPQAAHSITNYFVGLVMFCVRTASDETNETIAKAIAQLAIIVPSIVGFSFKDLKQSLRKEQCDPILMLSANVPGAKKLVIHGPDLSSIPSQFPVGDDTQFGSLLAESLDFFNIEPDRKNAYYLVDTKTKHIYLPSSYVRDFYPFRRNVYPQLSLVNMRPDLAGDKMRQQTFVLKFADINRTIFNDACLHALSSTAAPGQVFFIHDEFIRLPTFPRKALQFDHVELVSGSETAWLAKQLHKMDVLHKTCWVDFLSAFLCRLQPSLPIVVDLPLYISVLTGSLVLHTDETTSILRRSLALFINLARHYRTFFATEGYTFICPTIFQIYCCYAGVNADSVRVGIEFACKQMYIIHRKPFLLQLMGSVAELLIASPSVHYGKHLCNLIAQIGATPFDALNVMELVSEPKPLKTLDFCYEDEDPTFHLIDCIRLAVAVIAYGGDSPRSSRMLVILDAIVPQCVNSLTQTHTVGGATNTANLLHSHVTGTSMPSHGRKMQTGRDEAAAISELAACMKALVAACGFLTKGYAASERQLESTGLAFYMRHGRRGARGLQAAADADLDFAEKGAEDTATGQNLTALRDFRLPRDCLLSIMAAFFPPCVTRLRELHKTGLSSGGATSAGDQQSSRSNQGIHELLSARDHIRLAEISQTLLKVAPYDPPSMNCVGLERYMVDVLPATNWAQESTRPAFALILRRLDRLFARLVKKASLRQCLDWSAAAALITGVSSTLHQSMYLAHVKEIKSLITSCLNIILADPSEFSTGSAFLQSKQHGVDAQGQQFLRGGGSLAGIEEEDGYSERMPPAPSSAAFLFAVVRLLATEMQAQGELYNLSSVCEPLIGQSLTAAPPEKLHALVLSVLMPLLLSASVSTRTAFVMRKSDISHVLSLLLHLASPPHRHVVVSTSAYLGAGGGVPAMLAARVPSGRGAPVATQPLLPSALSTASAKDARGASLAMTAALVERERATSAAAAAEAHMAATLQWAGENFLATVFLGLKLLCLRFDAELASQWPLVAKHCRGLAMRPIASPSLWRFLGFLAAARPSLFALLAPFIRWKLSRLKLSDLSPDDSQLQSEVIQSMLSPGPPLPRAQLLLVCAEELRILRRNAAAFSAVGAALSSNNQQQMGGRGQVGGTPSATNVTAVTTEQENLPLLALARRTSSTVAAPVLANRLLHRSSTATTLQSDQGSTPRSSTIVQGEDGHQSAHESISMGRQMSIDSSQFNIRRQPAIAPSVFVNTVAYPHMPPFGWRRRGMVIKRHHRRDAKDDSHIHDLLAEIEGLPFADAASTSSDNGICSSKSLPTASGGGESASSQSEKSQQQASDEQGAKKAGAISKQPVELASSTGPALLSLSAAPSLSGAITATTAASSALSASGSIQRRSAVHPAQLSESLKLHSPHRLISGSVRPVLESAAEGEELQIEMMESGSKAQAVGSKETTSAHSKEATADEATVPLLESSGTETKSAPSSVTSEAMTSNTGTDNRSIVVIVEDSSANEEFL